MSMVRYAKICEYVFYDGDEIVNIGTGEDISILELAEMIKKAVGFIPERVPTVLRLLSALSVWEQREARISLVERFGLDVSA
ncbi:MAG: hypothetical protein UY64_C0021G0002 [Parcubacteria group bacterium GW2011_GWA1_51_12]|nr:MAG: hypothetical protein UY64_C0021G0002 [Parcubacteria group bacterium GW2011_GWA1_51_12]